MTSISDTSNIHNPHQLITQIRYDRKLDDTMKTYLIRAIDKKAYPLKRRSVVERENWDSFTEPRRIKISSHTKHCVDCGRSSYFIVNETQMLYAFRVCWEHLSQADRDMMEQFYWHSSLEPAFAGYERRVQETSVIV